jgi:tRNA G18 (ribose-2'-O)-methylase SpoU
MSHTVVVANNLRSTHNVGSLLRTAEGLGIDAVYLCGYTPYPTSDTDDRLPHIARKLTAQIHKTALGAENVIRWKHIDTLALTIDELRQQDYRIVALEQDQKSVKLSDYVRGDKKIALVLGNERYGLSNDELQLVDDIIEIPMKGSKESFNVVQAAAIAMYSLVNNV